MIAHMIEPRSLAYLQTIGSYCFRTISRSSKSGFVPTAGCQPGRGVGRGRGRRESFINIDGLAFGRRG
jgi:hypothetical protein